MQIRYVDDHAALGAMGEALATADRIGLDCEAAGYHRYSDRLCLIQLTAGRHTYLIDPLAIDPEPVLRALLEDPDVEVIMHGADFDIRLLDRDLGIGLRGLFDTQIAASLVGAEALGLSSLLEDRLDVSLSKKYQKADWAIRPLPDPMREYAAYDTLHLEALAEGLKARLDELDRTEWALEEFRELEKVRFDQIDDQDPVLRVKAARDLDPREVDRLREALDWRDAIARERDRALFRVAGDSVLVEAARRNPGSIGELEDLRGLNRSLARQGGPDLLDRFRRIESLGEDEIQGYPRLPREANGSRGRPPPEIEERIARLKSVRNAQAKALGVDRGTLVSNAILEIVATSPPDDLDDLRRVEGIRRWQIEALGEELLRAL